MADILAPTAPSGDLLDVLLADSLEREGFVPHMYLDVKGLVTVGVGHLLRTPQDALAPPFSVGGRPATGAEVGADWARVAAFPPALLAARYRAPSSPEVARDWAEADCRSRTANEFLPGVRRLLPGLDAFPVPAVRALAGMAYALGIGGLGGFRKLLAACSRGDWETAAAECRMAGASARTNAAHAGWFGDAARAG